MKSEQTQTLRRSPKRQPIYKDTGCHIAPACLACPLPACIHDYEAAGLNRSMPNRHRKRPAILRHRWRKLVHKPALPRPIRRHAVCDRCNGIGHWHTDRGRLPCARCGGKGALPIAEKKS